MVRKSVCLIIISFFLTGCMSKFASSGNVAVRPTVAQKEELLETIVDMYLKLNERPAKYKQSQWSTLSTHYSLQPKLGATYEHGNQLFSVQTKQLKNISTLEEASKVQWSFAIAINHYDRYSTITSDTHTETIHRIDHTNRISPQVTQYIVSNINGNLTLESGPVFTILNGIYSSVLENHIYTNDIQMPFSVEFDMFKDESMDTYKGEFIGKSLIPDSSETFVTTVIKDTSDYEYGLIKIFSNNTYEIIASE